MRKRNGTTLRTPKIIFPKTFSLWETHSSLTLRLYRSYVESISSPLTLLLGASNGTKNTIATSHLILTIIGSADTLLASKRTYTSLLWYSPLPGQMISLFIERPWSGQMHLSVHSNLICPACLTKLGHRPNREGHLNSCLLCVITETLNKLHYTVKCSGHSRMTISLKP